ncbi:MAG: endonuclease/exonuclease/phosphatase family protein [Chloroflexi bacterium]|nr:endonuclease/exonuclease/phosphatase family protein [Chloroflexota bacterium]
MSGTFNSLMIRTTTALAPAIPLIAAAFAIAEGLPLLRGALASLSVYLGQVRDIDSSLLAAMIFAIFLAGFGAPLIRRLLDARRAFLALAAVLALLRVAEQFTTEPGARLGIQIAGVVIWLWLVPLVVAGAHSPAKARAGAPPIVALLLGLTIDSAIKGAFGTLDLGTAPGLPPQITTVTLTSVQLALILWLTQARTGAATGNTPPLSSFVVGAGFALSVLVFQNLARHAALIGWELPAVFAWTLTANLIAIWVAIFLSRRGSVAPYWVSLLAAACLIACAAPAPTPALAAISAIVGPIAIALLWTPALAVRNGGGRGWFAAALGLLAIPVVLFGWYAHYEIDMPVPQWIIPIVAAAAVGAPACLRRPPSVHGVDRKRAVSRHLLPRQERTWEFGVLTLAFLLLLLPLHQLVTWNSPPASPAAASPLRVATYNIHQGFDASGRPGLDAIADVLESEQLQIVALQEVSRGWAVNGSVDALSWLSERLGMQAAWGPAADPLWGNAVLSRYPIVAVENRPMPNNGTLRFDRAYLIVTIAVSGEQIQVVATHLHHVQQEPQQRLPQVRALLDSIDWTRPTILLGDLNAQPHDEEMQLLTQSGLLAGDSLTPTYPAERPRRQIDYILATGHFALNEVRAIQTTASDHLPLTAVLLSTGDTE